LNSDVNEIAGKIFSAKVLATSIVAGNWGIMITIVVAVLIGLIDSEKQSRRSFEIVSFAF